MHTVRTMAILACLVVAASACSRHMMPSSKTVPTSPDMATIVFYHPTITGEERIFDVTTEETKYLGALQGKSKIAVQVPPGTYTFMVLWENADFASATVEAGYTYYFNVFYYPGVWSQRVGMRPVTKEKLSDPSFAKQADCTLLEKTPKADAWFAKKRAVVEKKRAKYYAKWMQKPESERPHLGPDDHL